MSVHGFTVYDMIARGAALHGAAPAIIQGEHTLSFGEFRGRVDALAGGLGALGINKGDRIAILAQNDAAYLALYGACARQGILAYPINWRLTGEVSPADPFAAISTAAVDVVPRGAVLTHDNVIMANLTAMAAMGISAADRYLLALPLFHITALGLSLAHLHAGSACVLVPRFDAEEAVRLIDRHGITHVSDFPPVLLSLLDAAAKQGSRLESLRHVSGLDAPQTIARLHAETGAQFWTGFGQSETSGFVSLQRVSERPGAAGRPVPLSQVAIVDDYDRTVPTGTAGEIVVRGPLVFQGYFDQPDVTAYTFRNGWHHTGDVGRFDADGFLHYVKRKPEKELIKPGGENVYPAEVETVIMQMVGVRGVCVYGIPDARWGEAIKAVVGAPGSPYSAEQVSEFVGSRIARFKRPHVVVFTEALPRAAEDGAVDREAVKAQWGDAR